VRMRTRDIISAFLDGLCGAGPFCRLGYLGEPTHIIDPRLVEEILASSEFEETRKRLLEKKCKDSDDLSL
jgi:hypothetical protein